MGQQPLSEDRSGTGNVAYNLTIAPEIYCGSCTSTQQFTPVTLIDNVPMNFQSLLSFATDEGNTGQDVQVVLTKFNTDQSLVQISAPRLRCDTVLTSYPGCRFYNYPPVLQLSLSDPEVDESAAHILDAQAELPGNVGHWDANPALRGSPLTRLMDKDMQKDNRNAAGALCLQRFPGGAQPGLDCDEYPFAATRQGANLVPESNMSVRYLDGSDNQASGGRLGNYLTSDGRVFDGEEFWVQITD